MISNDTYWSIHSQSAHDAATKIAAYLQFLSNKGVGEGPAGEAQLEGLPITVVDRIAIIPMMGPMIRRAGPIAMMFGIVGTDQIRVAVESAGQDPEIDHILLRIDSPGGSVSGLAELADAIHSIDKPVTAQVEGMAASAAYYTASQADRILVGRNDLVGSIGTRILLYDWSQYFEEAGIKAIPIDTGPFKSAGALGTEITEEQQADFQRIVDFYFDDFLAVVQRGRGMSEEQVRSVADGRVFTPAECLESGLIDGVATFEQTLTELRGQSQSGRSTQAARARLSI